MSIAVGSNGRPMVGTRDMAIAQLRAGRSRALRDLAAFVRIPSVSADAAHAEDVRRCTRWLSSRLDRIGMDRVRICAGKRQPLVLAEWRRGPGRPTVLLYAHFDVQPPGSAAEWTSPPFEPTVRGSYLHGRGASDDKGQLLAHLAAIDACLRVGPLPVNVLALFDGEEEIGSPGLPAFLENNRRALHADVALVSDTRMLGPTRPAITYSLRGNVSMTIRASGPRRDLHSGSFGGAVPNPARGLAAVLARLHHADGGIAVTGMYDSVRTLKPAERARMRAEGPSDVTVLRDAGIGVGWGEPGFTSFERTTIRPSLTIERLVAGSPGKAVIPASADARVSVRLVPDQEPQEIEHLLACYVTSVGARVAPGVRFEVRTVARTSPVVVDRSHQGVAAAARAYRTAFGRAPAFLRSGGSIPAVAALREQLGVETVLMGFALPSDGTHGPNERFHIPTFFRAMEASVHVLHNLAH